ncbi:MAG: Geranylgeranyl reductase flavoprotein [Candidatus Methanohalarchaeum thermophilum]|uniref:Geranylgeranyl reductase flavoprotein n=1 Tax=Methanohalarchaeum thermophilum TaxID=1903181 RepID=A0A1Q6DXN8_METT1|nr:MAG: Geranylgeranyl reductase flavoprotein [Candidatus Methanohalarchaeum thermophilum]
MEKDVVVIGGGPAGSSVAREAAKNGSEVLLLEKNNFIGEPVQCAGLLSKRAIDFSKIDRIRDIAINSYRGAIFHPPNEDPIKIKADEKKAFTVDRSIFDRKLVEDAIKEGAEFRVNSSAKKWDGKKLTIRHNGKSKKIEPSVLVSAEGIQRKIAKQAGLKGIKTYLSGVQTTLTNLRLKEEDLNYVELFLGENIAPGFFAWAIPLTQNKARVGLCVKMGEGSAFDYLKSFVKTNPVIKDKYNGKPIKFNFGCIPLGLLDKTVLNNLLVVGDAAGQVKPTSGGGVYPSLVCGKIAGEVASRNITNNLDLEVYEERWREKIGKELEIGWKLNKLFFGLQDKKYDRIFDKINDPEVIKTIEDYGDIDYPSKLFFKLLKNKPSLIKTIGSTYIKQSLKNLFT